MKWMNYLAAAACALYLCGCEDEYTINPDGSAKIRITHGGEIDLNFMIARSRGVDAWSDLSIEKEDGEVVRQSITAYVPDITKCLVYGYSSPLMVFQKMPDGSIVLSEKVNYTVEPLDLEDEELERMLSTVKHALGQKRRSFRDFLKKNKIYTVQIQTAEKCVASPHFVKQENGSHLLTMDIEKQLAVIEKWEKDEAKLRELAAFGRRDADKAIQQAINLELYGTKAPLAVRIPAGGDPLFNYAAEVEEARENERAMLSGSGLYRTVLPEEPSPNPVESVALVSASSNGGSSMKIQFQAKLVKNITHALNAEVVSAINSTGESQFPAVGYSGAGSAKTYPENRAIQYSTILPVPKSGVYKTITCVLPLGISTQKKIQDIGETDFKAPLEKDGVKITLMVRGRSYKLSYVVNTTAPFSTLKWYDKYGKQMHSRSLLGESPHSGSFEFMRSKLEKGRFELITYDDFKIVEVPVTLENVKIPQ